MARVGRRTRNRSPGLAPAVIVAMLEVVVEGGRGPYVMVMTGLGRAQVRLATDQPDAILAEVAVHVGCAVGRLVGPVLERLEQERVEAEVGDRHDLDVRIEV